MTYNEGHVSRIRSMVGFIAEVVVYPGEDELNRSLSTDCLPLTEDRDKGVFLIFTDC